MYHTGGQFLRGVGEKAALTINNDKIIMQRIPLSDERASHMQKWKRPPLNFISDGELFYSTLSFIASFGLK